MSVYYVLLVVILVLAGINFGTLHWVAKLQRRLHSEPSGKAHQAPQAVPAATPDQSGAVKREAHSVLLAEELLKLEASTHHSFDEALDQATKQFSHDLAETTAKINASLEQRSVEMVGDKLNEYQQALEEMRQTAVSSMGQIQASIEEKRQSLEQGLNSDIEQQKARLEAKLDQRLSDVISAYLVDVLGNQVDLGAQSAYLFKTLEDHKEELKKDILGEP